MNDENTVKVPAELMPVIETVLRFVEVEMVTTPYEQETESFDAALQLRRWLGGRPFYADHKDLNDDVREYCTNLAAEGVPVE